jgi:bacterioferritin-associated ferredoxin
MSVEDIGDACGAGTGCGGCHDSILDVVAEEARVTTPPPASPGIRRLRLVLSEVA